MGTHSIDIFSDDPYRTPPPFEKLVGHLHGANSRRMNTQHRIVYEIEVGRGAGRVARPFG